MLLLPARHFRRGPFQLTGPGRLQMVANNWMSWAGRLETSPVEAVGDALGFSLFFNFLKISFLPETDSLSQYSKVSVISSQPASQSFIHPSIHPSFSFLSSASVLLDFGAGSSVSLLFVCDFCCWCVTP